MKHTLFFGVVLTILLFMPGGTEAYFTTDQKAFTIDGKTAIFFIEFKFGHGSHDVHIPAWTLQGEEKTDDRLSYSIINDRGEPAHGKTVSMVISGAEFKDGVYIVPKERRETFTFVTFFIPSTQESGDDFKVQVTHLPFSFDGTQRLALNPSELTYYVTPTVTLK